LTFQLPDCQGIADAFTLSADDRRELVRRIAEQGPGAIDAFLREREQTDGLIARKVAKLREELLRRAEEMRRRLAEEFGGRLETVETEYRERLARLEAERAGLEGRLSKLNLDDAALLEMAARSDPLLVVALDHDVAAQAPWWRRAWAAFLRFLRWLLTPLAWLVRKLSRRGEGADRDRGEGRDRVVLATGGAGNVLLDRAGGLYLSNADFRRAVKQRLRAAPPAERVRRAVERMLGLEDYESLARKAMRQMLAEDAERARGQADRQRAEAERAIGEILERERAEEAQREATQRQLREQQEREARQLEEALRNAPEREVKEAIVDELKAAGLLRETERGLTSTLQLMERFASLVYEDEARTMGGRSGAATGDYAEGEGHYLRGPLRAAIEVSRMDIPASRLRARSRHPRVRHMFDDDVVVYREERTSAMHVVLIVDRSGSMEENGRMEAAKRAALALHHAVRRRNSRNRVDLLLMDTSVRPATLRDVWETEPTGFTNTGAALRLARELARKRRSDRLLVYLVTDGLPEAYTRAGEDVAGHPDKAMAYAREQAKLLRRERGLAGFVMLLLEPKDERYVKAARSLAKDAGGRVIDVDPQELAAALLKSFEGTTSAPTPNPTSS
jgi:Mg-chelatase subunit ChlD